MVVHPEPAPRASAQAPAFAQLCPLLVLELGCGSDLCPLIRPSEQMFALQVTWLPLSPARPAGPYPTMPYSETSSNTWGNVSAVQALCWQPGRAGGELGVGWAGGDGTWHSPKLTFSLRSHSLLFPPHGRPQLGCRHWGHWEGWVSLGKEGHEHPSKRVKKHQHFPPGPGCPCLPL